MSHLQRIFESAGTDKGKPHLYGDYYQRHFEEIRNDNIQILEVGIFEGKSLTAWREYFPNAQITGVDIAPLRKIILPGVKNVVADINEWLPEQPYDIIIDDGSHQAPDVMNTLSRLWPWVTPNGWYVIEDWATQFMESYGGDPTGSMATRFLYKIVDRLLQGVGPVCEIHIYRELVFLRKLPVPVQIKSDEQPAEVEPEAEVKPKPKPRGRPKKAVAA